MYLLLRRKNIYLVKQKYVGALKLQANKTCCSTDGKSLAFGKGLLTRKVTNMPTEIRDRTRTRLWPKILTYRGCSQRHL